MTDPGDCHRGPHEEPVAFIDPLTGQVKLELEIQNRISPTAGIEPGTCAICKELLDPRAQPVLASWNRETGFPELHRDPTIGRQICTDCEKFVEHLHRYRRVGPVSAFRFEEGEFVGRQGYSEIYRVIARRHAGALELRSWWPVYLCHPVEVRRGLLPRVRREVEIEFTEEELVKLPSGILADLMSMPAPQIGAEAREVRNELDAIPSSPVKLLR